MQTKNRFPLTILIAALLLHLMSPAPVLARPAAQASVSTSNNGAVPSSRLDEADIHTPLNTDISLQQTAYVKPSNTRSYRGAFNFGDAVAVAGDTIVVGAKYESSNATGVNGDQSSYLAQSSGAAYVFVRTEDSWSQQAYLKASNTDEIDLFGGSVAVSGDTVVVGAYGESSNASGVNGNQDDNSADGAGAVYVFVRNGNTWSQQAYLKASNTEAGANFGWSVAISGDTIVVGATDAANHAGAAYIFVRNGTTWSQQAHLKAPAAGYFGQSVAIAGDTVVIGANAEANVSGAAYVFVRSGATWSQQAHLKASNTEAGDHFGWSVAIADDTIVVGAINERSNATGVDGNQSDNSARDSGAAYIFVRSGTTWSQQAYLKASNTDVDDHFGESVAIAGDTVVVGAVFESSNTTGIDGPDNNSASRSGAAYVFVRSGLIWSQQAYVKASNTDEGDHFGSSVSVAADTVVIGSYLEKSNATGVNGNQANNTAYDAGAVYIFEDIPTLPASDASVDVQPGQVATLTFNDVGGGRVLVEVPAGAVSQNTTLLFDDQETPSQLAPFQFAGRSFTLTAYRNNRPQSNFTFQEPITITIDYTDTDVANLNENELELFFYSPTSNSWSERGITVLTRDINNNHITLEVTHLTEFAMGTTKRVYLPLVNR